MATCALACVGLSKHGIFESEHGVAADEAPGREAEPPQGGPRPRRAAHQNLTFAAKCVGPTLTATGALLGAVSHSTTEPARAATPTPVMTLAILPCVTADCRWS